MKEHTVIAEMVDVVTGDRKFPNEGFTPHDDDQAARLIAAGCLKEGSPPKVEKAEEETEAAPRTGNRRAPRG